MPKSKKVSKKKPAPLPGSAEESDEQLSPRHSPRPGSARDQSPDYRSEEEGSLKQGSPTHVPETVEAHRADSVNSPVQSDQSSSDHSDSSSSESDEGSGEDSNVVSGDNKESAKTSPERVDISSDCEPDKGAIGSVNPQKQAGSAGSPPNVAIYQALSSSKKVTDGSEPDASPKLAVLSQHAQERPGNQPPQPSVSSPSKRDKNLFFQPHGNSAQHAPADEGQADGSPEQGKLESTEFEEEKPEERQEKRMKRVKRKARMKRVKRKARKEKLREAQRQGDASAKRAAEIHAPNDSAIGCGSGVRNRHRQNSCFDDCLRFHSMIREQV
jgi:hypothetical protein